MIQVCYLVESQLSVFKVKSPFYFILDNKTYFHMYNQYHQECVSRRGKQLFIEACDLNQCSQKWSWSPSQQIISALDYANPYCISVDQLVNKINVVLDSCQSGNSFQKWECKDYDLLRIQGQNLYFNYGNTGTDIVLFTGNGSWSRWVKYSTGRVLCDGGWFCILIHAIYFFINSSLH